MRSDRVTIPSRHAASDPFVGPHELTGYLPCMGGDATRTCEVNGVAVLSGTDSGSGSGSELTEPGSPCSPASCSSDDGGARVPPWSRRVAAPCRKRQPVHQGTITQYFNHKMKTTSLKRDYAWNKTEDAKKRCTQKPAAAQDIEKYISMLSHTLNPKVHLDMPKEFGKTPENMYSKNYVRSCPRPKIVPVYTETVEVNKIQEPDVNGTTHGSNNILLSNDSKKPINKKETSRRTSNKKTNCKLKQPPTIRKTTWFRLEESLPKSIPNRKSEIKSLTSLPVDRGTVNFADTAPKITMANGGNGLRTIPITFNGAINGLHQIPNPNASTCGQINLTPQCQQTTGTVPSSQNLVNNMSNMPTNLSPFVALPQVLLTALRLPQQQTHSLNPSNGINGLNGLNGLSNMNGFARQNMNINVNTSPTKLNGQFVFPLVQNLNGAVVQIPNLMTKVGHNFMIPHSAQMQPQQLQPQQLQPQQLQPQQLQSQQLQPQQLQPQQLQPQQLQPHRPDPSLHQQGQMVINGTFLKLTTSMAPAYSTITTKPTTTSNISYPLINKSLNTAQPTVVTSKPHFTTLNVGSHSVLMPQPGYFINPVPNNNFNFGAQNQVNTSCALAPAVVPSPVIRSDTPCYQVGQTSSIPIPPVKPPDKENVTNSQDIRVASPPTELQTEHKKLTLSDYPNLTKLLSSTTTLPPQMLTRPFAQVCNSTEKLLDITPAPTEESKFEKDFQDELHPDEEISPASTPESDETVYTEITVMKQVSSDVQSTVMETTFSCVTNESSESGIGTDKSLDSPSDSPSSKDCDDDSLSLSVSVCSVEVQPCQKSPILKQPKTLRFPPSEVKRSDKKGKRSASGFPLVPVCRWENCRESFTSDTDLLDHLQVAHVTGQAGRENYVCLWTGCKVRGKPSCSRLWLERHALSHAGNKPFKCIVDDCDRRFSTQVLLERHVNNHFNEQSAGVNGAKKSADSGPKLIRRNGKVLRYRRQPWSARMFDFFDGGMMEGLAWRLVRVTCWRAQSQVLRARAPAAHRLTLVAALTGVRYNAVTNTREALVTYSPPHILEDEWVPESEVQQTKSVDMSQLPAKTKVLLYEQFCDSYRPVAAPQPLPQLEETPRSSLMLNKLIAGKKTDRLNGLNGLNGYRHRPRQEERREVSGAAKRKMGRRQGGNAFWPCGR